MLKGTGQLIGCVLRRVDNISAFFMKRISVETINHIGKDITLGLTNEQMDGSGELAIDMSQPSAVQSWPRPDNSFLISGYCKLPFMYMNRSILR